MEHLSIARSVPSRTGERSRRALLWFRNDLRIADHPVLAQTARAVETLLPVYIFADRLFGTTSLGFRKTGPYRAAFLIDTVATLQEALRERGSDLFIFRGDPAAILVDLVRSYDITEVWYQDEPGTEEAEEVAALYDRLKEETSTSPANRRPITVRSYTGQTLYHPADLPFPADEIPDRYTDFRKGVEASGVVRDPFPTPERLPPPPARVENVASSYGATPRRRGVASPNASATPSSGITSEGRGAAGGLPTASRAHTATPADRSAAGALPTVEELSGVSLPPEDRRGVMAFRGGEAAARQRLAEYVWERDRLKSYKRTRNGLIGADYSSKLSPWLANGALSPRIIYGEVRRYEAERVKNDSTYWLIFELIWRDYFSFLLRTYPREMFCVSGPQGRTLRWKNDRRLFDRWRRGETGERFIDANMREIAATGYMSNRGRQNVASYLARDLGVNWLLGAEYFESLLIDYDPASNYGNWTYTVGVGTDPRRDRYFDPPRQAARYDAQGRYRRLWLGDER